MNIDSEPMYWSENEKWYKINKEKDRFELTKEAPPRAVKSFEMWKKLNNLKY